ncbi:MAG TPA: glycosyltransferase family 1 protein [Isosphaeraceae bacterium]|nr:glycosyltransferase family 1 protein [Isosphaeraceae bacterium]
MRVSVITETYFPQVNGVSRTLGELVRHLTERGDLVQLIHPNYGEPAGRPDVHLVRSVIVPFYKELYLPLPPFGSVRRAIDMFQPDVVHIATEATLGLTVLRHVLRRKLVTVSSFHTNFDQYSRHYRIGWANWTIWRYLRWFHNRTRETYVPSLTTIKGLETLGFERLVLWPRGVDSTLFRPDRPGRQQVRRALGWGPNDLVISYVSRIAPEKNVSYLADALAIVAARRPDVRILFVGDGPTRSDLERRIGAIARFAGYRMGEELADYYSAGDLFAFSSLTETFGNVVLEAMASGMPVAALRAGGVGDTVQPGKTGLLVEPAEPPTRFAEALLALIAEPARLRAMAEAARAYALSQSWDAIMGELRQRYQLAIDFQASASPEAAARV